MKAWRVLLLLAIAGSAAPGAWSQQVARLRTVGILLVGAPATACGSGAVGAVAACMVDELRVLGHVEGRNIAFEYRFASGDYTRLPALAAELVALHPEVLYTHTGAGADAAALATTTIPIVAGPVGEEVLLKLAGQLARPVRNLTGQSLGAFEQNQKCLQLLKELAPRTARVAWIRNPDNPTVVQAPSYLDAASAQLGLTLIRIDARHAADLPQAFAAIAASGADAIFMADDAALAGSGEVRKLVSAWALGRRLPLASSNASFASDGALLSLGADVTAIARRAAYYVHRILGGARPGDLPIEGPTIFKLTLNRRTGSALGLTMPQALLLRADEVIR